MLPFIHEPSDEGSLIFKHKRIFVLAKLDIVGLLLAITFRLLRYKVIFVHPVGMFRRKNVCDKLSKFGITINGFVRLPGYNPWGLHHLSEKCAEALVQQYYPLEIIENEITLFPTVDDAGKKIRTLLYSEFFGAFYKMGEALTIAKYLSEAGAKVIIHHEVNLHGALLHKSRILSFSSLFPHLIQSVIYINKKFISFGLARMKRFFSLRASHSIEQYESKSSLLDHGDDKVLFFPHKGVSYGSFFEKDQYYVDEVGHPLSRKGILHVELEVELRNDERPTLIADYAQRGLDCAGLTMGSKGEFKIPVAIKGYLQRAILILTARNTWGWFNGLSSFPKARIALLGYEIVFPTHLSFALQARNVKVIAILDRYETAWWRSNAPILNGYLVHSPKSQEWIEENPFSVIDRIDVCGDPRTIVLNKYLKEEQDKIASQRKKVIFYDFFSDPDELNNSILAFGNWDNNIIFYEATLKVAKALPDVDFIIRGKNVTWTTLPFFKDIYTQILSQPNLEVTFDYEAGSGYRLAAQADCIVARFTSIADQSMAAGIPVLLYEKLSHSDKCLSWACEFGKFPIFTYTADEIINRLNDTLYNELYMPTGLQEKFRNDFFKGMNVDVEERVRNSLEFWLKQAEISSDT